MLNASHSPKQNLLGSITITMQLNYHRQGWRWLLISGSRIVCTRFRGPLGLKRDPAIREPSFHVTFLVFCSYGL